jgi:hypothetical protein
MNSDSYLYFNIAQEIRLYINSTMKHQLKFYIVLFFIQLFPLRNKCRYLRFR